jgi:hypothetical protein
MTDFAMPLRFSAVRASGRRPLTPAYLGVLLVWAGLFLIRPRLALKLFSERRADSPIPRL